MHNLVTSHVSTTYECFDYIDQTDSFVLQSFIVRATFLFNSCFTESFQPVWQTPHVEHHRVCRFPNEHVHELDEGGFRVSWVECFQDSKFYE